jgi:hypothetical protein
MLAGYGIRSQVPNSFERHRLRWITMPTIKNTPDSLTTSGVTLADYVTTGDAYRLEIDSASGQYFYIENHQSISEWENDLALGGTIEPGIYLLRKDANSPSGSAYRSEYFRMIPADGRHNWTVDYLIENPFGENPDSLPVYKKLDADRVNGYHDLQQIPYVWGGVNKSYDVLFTDLNGQPVQDVKYKGDGKDAFRWGYNEVLSPWSNPNSQRYNKSSTPYGFKINSNPINGIFNLNIYKNSAFNAPPSIPQNLKVSANTSDEAVLNWLPNTEPDIIKGGKYKIYRAEIWGTGEPTSWTLAATINAYNGSTPVTSWTDTETNIYTGPRWLHYKISALDSQFMESLCSEKVKINGRIPKQNNGDNDFLIINEYKLNQNFPNPFNPSTLIKYSIKEPGLVSLKVFNILGKEVSILVNEVKPMGMYEIEFNASNLPSGVYIYSLKVNDFSSNHKMLLLK